MLDLKGIILFAGPYPLGSAGPSKRTLHHRPGDIPCNDKLILPQSYVGHQNLLYNSCERIRREKEYIPGKKKKQIRGLK